MQTEAGTKGSGRPKTRLEKDIKEYLKIMKINSWGKTHPGSR
jgi:hypothetical protein